MRVIYFILLIILLTNCTKSKSDNRPTWKVSKTADSVNVKITYMGDTSTGSRDEVFVYCTSKTDTLKGIFNRATGSAYSWNIPASDNVQAMSVMRLTGYKWIPVSSYSLY